MNANPTPLYLQKYIECEDQQTKLLEFVHLVASPKRPDGTYNHCREALEQRANELLKEFRHSNEK